MIPVSKALRRLFTAFILTAGILSCTTVLGQGSGVNPNPGTLVGARNEAILTAVPFLRITPDARAGGMGDIGAATSPDVNSAWWNPGKLANNTTTSGIGASYTPWLTSLGLNDMWLTHLSGYYKLRKEDAIGISMTYFNLGSLTFTDQSGATIRTFNPNEFSLAGT